ETSRSLHRAACNSLCSSCPKHAARAPRSTKAGNRGRLEELELDVRQLLAGMLELLDDLLRSQLALGPGLQIDETGPGVRAPALRQHLVTGQRRDRVDAVDGAGNLLQLVRLGIRVFQRRAGRRLQDPIDHPLVLERDEARWKLRIHEKNSDAE